MLRSTSLCDLKQQLSREHDDCINCNIVKNSSCWRPRQQLPSLRGGHSSVPVCIRTSFGSNAKSTIESVSMMHNCKVGDSSHFLSAISPDGLAEGNVAGASPIRVLQQDDSKNMGRISSVGMMNNYPDPTRLVSSPLVYASATQALECELLLQRRQAEFRGRSQQIVGAKRPRGHRRLQQKAVTLGLSATIKAEDALMVELDKPLHMRTVSRSSTGRNDEAEKQTFDPSPCSVISGSSSCNKKRKLSFPLRRIERCSDISSKYQSY